MLLQCGQIGRKKGASMRPAIAVLALLVLLMTAYAVIIVVKGT
jgi:hypothetical protein